MGSLVSLLVLGAIYAVVYVVKNLAPSGGKGAQLFGEEFPEVEVLEPQQQPQPQPEFVAAMPEKRPVKPKQKRGGASKPVSQPQPVHPVEEGKDDKKPASEGRLVRLNNKSEAKRAFIYSEIFNRKY